MGSLESTKAYQKRLISSGICLGCRNPVEVLGKRKCDICQEKERIRHRQWKKENQDKVKANAKRYYAKHSSRERSRMKKWELENKEHMLIVRKINKYKYKHRRNVAGKFSLSEWKSLLSKFNNQCLWCGNTSDITVDHVIPLILGGTNYIHNIQPLCRVCNSKKHDKIIDFRPFGSAIMEWT